MLKCLNIDDWYRSIFTCRRPISLVVPLLHRQAVFTMSLRDQRLPKARGKQQQQLLQQRQQQQQHSQWQLERLDNVSNLLAPHCLAKSCLTNTNLAAGTVHGL